VLEKRQAACVHSILSTQKEGSSRLEVANEIMRFRNDKYANEKGN